MTEKKKTLEQRKDERFTHAVAKLSNSQDGLIFLEWLYKICKYESFPTYKGANGIDMNQMILNHGYREIYVEVRKYLKPEALKKIEIDGVIEHAVRGK